MKTSDISFKIELDEERIPNKIFWNATEKGDEGFEETKAISLSLWDHLQQNTMRIDLWSKDMAVDDMKKFYIDTIGGLAQSLLNATGDEYMANEMNKLCEKLVKHVEEEIRNARKQS
jgi:gliding motility-associated protein GldC